VLSQLDILSVVSDYVDVRRIGASYKALCPFPDHEEGTASFVVSPHKGICKCFGCGEGGSAIKFVAKIEGVNYSQAISILKKKYDLKGLDYTLLTSNKNQEENEAKNNTHKKLLEFSKGFLNYLEGSGLNQSSLRDDQLVAVLKKNGFVATDVQKFKRILDQYEREK